MDSERQRIRPVVSQNRQSQSEVSREGLSSDKARKSSWDLVSYRRILRHSGPDGYILERFSPRTKLFHSGKEGRKYRDPENSWERSVGDFSTRKSWTTHDGSGRAATPEVLAGDVNIFFDKVKPDNPTPMDMQHACEIADQLLRLSLGFGSVQEIRSLLLWKIAANVLSIEDLDNIVGAFAVVAGKMGPEPTLQFYSDLFATATFEHQAPSERLRLELKLRAEALKMDDVEGGCRALTDSICIPAKLEYNKLAEMLGRECRELVRQGHLNAAVDLWCTTTKARASYSAVDAELENELYDAAITAKHASLCVSMLRLKSSLNFNHNMRQQKDALIKLCFEEGSTGLLRNLFRIKAEGALGHSKLSTRSYVCLAQCFAEDSKGFESFKVYYKRVPPAFRGSVAEASVAARAFSLKADWKATRDLERVRTDYQLAIDRYAQDGIDEQCLRPLNVAMTEIQLSANQPVQAMKALAVMNGPQLDSDVAMLTALALAKQGDWPSFERLLHALHKEPLEWTPGNKRAFNNALHLFSRHHTAQQLSDLAERSISQLNFQPNRATWEILLSSFVSKRSVSLLRHWLCNPGLLERKTELDADIGAVLMKTWYLDFRHSHLVVMWVCRELVRKAPSLHGGQLWNVMREALGFDLRTLGGTNAPWMEPIIRARAELISEQGAEIPRPGHVWNRQLYDRGQLLTIDQGASMEAERYDSPQEETKLSYSESFKGDDVLPTKSLDWQELRPSYMTSWTEESIPDTSADKLDVPTLERQMIVQLSLGEHQTVLQMYQDSLDAAGLPASPIMLEVALEASIRFQGHAEEAERIITAASQAGMNIACAIGPLLIHQIRQLTSIDQPTATSLRHKVIDYYRMNERNGLHVKHHIGTHAAHTLMHNGHADLGVNLLATIFKSPWSASQPLDLTALSVWFTGYAHLGHLRGMHWVVEEILARGLSIDMPFIRTLRRARRPAQRLADGRVVYGTQERRVLAYLKFWSGVFRQKREEQMRESKRFGRKLVRVLAEAANGGGEKRGVPRGVGRKLERRRAARGLA